VSHPYKILVGSTFIAQLFLFAISPIIARIYNPEEVGAFGVVLAIGAFLASLATGRLEMALPLIKNRLASIRVLILAFIFIIFFSSLTFIVLLSLYMTDVLYDTAWSSLQLFSITAVCFSLALFNVANSLLVRGEKFSKIGQVKLYQGFLTGVFQLLAPLFLNGSFFLIWGQIIGYLAGGIIGFKVFYKDILTVVLSFKLNLKRTLSSFRKYPLTLAPAAVFNQASQHIPVIAIGYLYGLYSAGLYVFVVKVCNTPIALLGQAVSQVYSSKIRFYLHSSNQTILTKYIQLLVILFFLGVFVISLLVIFLYFWGVYFFGDKWENIGTVALLLSPMFFADFFSTPLSITLSYLDKHSQQFKWDVFRFFSLLLFFGFSYKFELTHGKALFGVSIIWFINAVIHVYLTYRACAINSTSHKIISN
jgi:O-antigen/teichoic acid export membrane protein